MKPFPRCRMLILAAGFAVVAVRPGAAHAQTFTEWTVPTAASHPTGIVAGPDGNLWFTEDQSNKIAKITTSGVITEYPGLASSAEGIAVGPDGNLWFTEFSGNRIGKITPAGVITEYAIPGGNSPYEITAGPVANGHLWFTEWGRNRIGEVDTSGNFLNSFPVAGAVSLRGIALGSDDNLWFIESGAKSVGKITTAGVVTKYSIPSNRGWEITAGPDGNLWFTESGSAVIGKLTTGGAITEYPTPANNYGIISGPGGNLWYASWGGKIGKMTTGGVVTEYSVPGGRRPTEIAVGPDGNIWFTEQNDNRIGRLIPNSAIAGASPSSKDFGSVAIHTSSSAQSFSISNTGNTAMNVSEIAVTGGDSGMFVVNAGNGAGGTCGATPTIAAAGSCTISVTFAPTSIGAKATTLRITSDDPLSPATAALNGTGTGPAPIPSLSEWGMLILGCGLAAVMFLALRVRQHGSAA